MIKQQVGSIAFELEYGHKARTASGMLLLFLMATNSPTAWSPSETSTNSSDSSICT